MLTITGAVLVCALSAAPAPAGERPPIAVTLELSGPESIEVVLENRGDQDLKVRSPQLQNALTFTVLDDMGNVVAPIGLAKISPKGKWITLRRGQKHRHRVAAQRVELAKARQAYLPFLSRTGLFGYALEPGKAYRVVAIYRPGADDAPGIPARDEVLLRLPK